MSDNLPPISTGKDELLLQTPTIHSEKLKIIQKTNDIPYNLAILLDGNERYRLAR
ncbi:MAG: hypothetical protein AB1757_14430 [Acidobacteriota bacterium]